MGSLAKAARTIAPAQNTAIQFVDDAGNPITISQQDVVQFVCPNADAREVVFFMELCRSQRLNPFTREAFLVKYGNQAASMITAEVVFERRANAHPDFGGMECGVVYMTKDGEIQKREGTATYKVAGETLIGGWARVHRSGRSDSYAEVSLDEYDKKQSVWKSMPGVMITKCAKGVALRQAFPSDFQGMYLQEEVGVAPNIEEVYEATVGESDDKPSDADKTELRSLTNSLAEAGYDSSEMAHLLYDQYKQGGMDAARQAAYDMLESVEAAAVEVTEA